MLHFDHTRPCHVSPSLDTLFHLPLSELAFQQLTQLAQDIQDAVFSEEHNVWSFLWGSFHFSVSRVYRHLLGSRDVHNIFKRIWKTRCQHKHIVSFWLLLKERLSTRSLLRRRGMELPSFGCVLCSCQTEGSQFHLFLDCQFAQVCGNLLGLQITNSDPFQIIENFSTQLIVPFSLDIIIIMAWCIWMARNDLIFKGFAATLNSV